MITLIIENNSQDRYDFKNRISSRSASVAKPRIEPGERLVIEDVQQADLYWWEQDLIALKDDADFSLAILNTLEGTFISYGAITLDDDFDLGAGTQRIANATIYGNLTISEGATLGVQTVVVMGDINVIVGATGGIDVQGSLACTGELSILAGTHEIRNLNVNELSLANAASLDVFGGFVNQTVGVAGTSTLTADDLFVGGVATIAGGATMTTKAARLAAAAVGAIANTPAVVIP